MTWEEHEGPEKEQGGKETGTLRQWHQHLKLSSGLTGTGSRCASLTPAFSLRTPGKLPSDLDTQWWQRTFWSLKYWFWCLLVMCPEWSRTVTSSFWRRTLKVYCITSCRRQSNRRQQAVLGWDSAASALGCGFLSDQWLVAWPSETIQLLIHTFQMWTMIIIPFCGSISGFNWGNLSNS